MTRDPTVVPVLLCGGAGTRLWPLSRAMLPKQFVALAGAGSLLEATCRRVGGVGRGRWIAVSNVEHRFLVAEELRKAGVADATVILEPVARNTAPAIAAAALAAHQDAADAVLVVLPSDHLIGDTAAFQQALGRAVDEARQGALVTFGVVPTRPDTGYGYIRASAVGRPIADVEAFVEKPDAATAEEYVDSGRYLWNSGMFVFRAERFLEELGRHRPAMLAAVRAAWDARRDDTEFRRLDHDAFAAVEGESIDYAVMENTSGGRVVALQADWSDVGSWDALWSVADRDAAGNALVGDCVAVDVRDSYLRSEGRLVAAVGLRDHIVVETADAVLVAPRDRAQDVKALVDRLRSDERGEIRLPARVPRPWGDYEGLDRGARYQVKRITVAPGAALSVQKHRHRAEHWTVVEGTARIRCDDREFDLAENQSTFIPLGAIHRLENRGTTPLILIEVQCGGYLGEDDIIRIEDRYGRTES